VRVDAAWKPELLQRLAGEGIHYDSVYPPLSEVRRLAFKVARDTVDQLT